MLTQPPSGIATNPDWLYSELLKRMQASADPLLPAIVDAHIQAKTRYNTLVELKLSHSSKKVVILKEIVQAVIRKDYSTTLLAPSKDRGKQPIVQVSVEEGGVAQTVLSGNSDEALAKLIKILSTPGIVVEVNVQVTIERK